MVLNPVKFSQADSRVKMWFPTFREVTPSPTSGCCWCLGRTKTESYVSYPVLCMSPLGLGAGWNGPLWLVGFEASRHMLLNVPTLLTAVVNRSVPVM